MSVAHKYLTALALPIMNEIEKQTVFIIYMISVSFNAVLNSLIAMGLKS